VGDRVNLWLLAIGFLVFVDGFVVFVDGVLS